MTLPLLVLLRTAESQSRQTQRHQHQHQYQQMTPQHQQQKWYRKRPRLPSLSVSVSSSSLPDEEPRRITPPQDIIVHGCIRDAINNNCVLLQYEYSKLLSSSSFSHFVPSACAHATSRLPSRYAICDDGRHLRRRRVPACSQNNLHLERQNLLSDTRSTRKGSSERTMTIQHRRRTSVATNTSIHSHVGRLGRHCVYGNQVRLRDSSLVKIVYFVITTMAVFLFFVSSSSSSSAAAAAASAFSFPLNPTSSRVVVSRFSPPLLPQSCTATSHPSTFQQSHLTNFDRPTSSSSASWRRRRLSASSTTLSETVSTDDKRMTLFGDATLLKSTYTVKELKDLIKSQIKDKTDRPSSLSTMKKDDIIRWIVDNRSKMIMTTTNKKEQPVASSNDNSQLSASIIAARLDNSDDNDMTTATPTSRPRNGKMPPRKQQMPPRRASTAATTTESTDATSDSAALSSSKTTSSSSTTTTTTSKRRSPRELGLHELYETYPPLRPKIRLTLKEISDKKKKKKLARRKNDTEHRSSNDDDDGDDIEGIDTVNVEDGEDEEGVIEELDDIIMVGSEGDEDEEWMTTSFTGLGELDFRQHYHPMMRSLRDQLQQQSSTASSSSSSLSSSVEDSESDTTCRNDEDDDSMTSSSSSLSSSPSTILSRQRLTSLLSGEMDLIFVGTASCTPGTTRGVSCTALRLNHQHSNFPSGAAAAAKKKMTKTTHADAREEGRGRPSEQTLGTWIFDVGESTQLQIQRTSSVRPSKITKIFITHAHGDHSFGLPGLLCLMGADRPGGANGSMDDVNDNTNDVVDIYGPEGLRMWLRVAIRYSVSRICPKYRVHELKDVPMAPEWKYFPRAQRYIYRGFNGKDPDERQWSDPKEAFNYSNDHWLRRYDSINLPPSERYSEVEGGKDIYPQYDHPMSSDGAPIWEVEGFDQDDDPIKVYAAPMSHGIPCVGYSIHEMDRPGRLKDEFVRPIVDKNLEGLKDAGFRHPLKSMAIIKTMKPGETFKFPDGTVLSHEEAVEPSRPGRRVVILGDTCSARTMEKLAANADVVVHEATNTYLYGLDAPTATLRDTTRDAVVHGHSTPHIAGLFARQVNAHRLILNHFSARYKGDCSLESMTIMNRIEQQAVQKSGLGKGRVAAAWDFMIFPIPLRKGNV